VFVKVCALGFRLCLTKCGGATLRAERVADACRRIYLALVKSPRLSALLAIFLLAAGCSSQSEPSADPTADWRVGNGPQAPITGRAFVFGPNNSGLSLEGATVSVAEAPEIHTTVMADGSFSFEVPSGAPLSFLVEQPDFHLNQSAAIPIGPDGIAMLGFQVPTEDTFNLLAILSDIDEIDPTRCQISTTVSRAGTEPYGGPALGEPDVVVSIEPPLPKESGPIYFAYVSDSTILPHRTLTATSIDGGVIFANVPPGEYVLKATKEGKQFTPVEIRCRAGHLVNAAPPNGLQEI